MLAPRSWYNPELCGAGPSAHLKLTAKAIFTPTGKTALTEEKCLTLTRSPAAQNAGGARRADRPNAGDRRRAGPNGQPFVVAGIPGRRSAARRSLRWSVAATTGGQRRRCARHNSLIIGNAPAQLNDRRRLASGRRGPRVHAPDAPEVEHPKTGRHRAYWVSPATHKGPPERWYCQPHGTTSVASRGASAAKSRQRIARLRVVA